MALRPKIVKLAKMVGGLTGMVNHIDENAPEYYALECVVSDEQADVALQLGLRKERTAQYVAEKCGKSLEETQKILMELAQIGVCKVYHNEDGQEVFLVQIFAPGILEMMVNNDEQVKAHPQIGRAFEEYTRLRIASIAPNLPMGTGMMRVTPIETAISADTQSVPYERLSYYLDKYDTFSVSDCSCRKSRRVLGQGCGHLEHEMCIQMGTGAEYYIRTGRARQITRREAEEILRKAEENGLMHQIPNIEGLGESAAICNCCSCSCFAMRVATMFRSPDAIRSNYVSQVDTEKCVACGQCVENCPTNALRLGQKLCAKEPVPEKPYQKVRDHVWGEKHWNVDYRENRVDVAESGTAPCKTACPAHIAVQGYIKLAALGKYTEALELIKKENPFPAVCGRICPRSCESACTRGDVDEPIAIDEIKKFIADQDLNEKSRFIPKKRHDYQKMVAVIGSGPAGRSCAGKGRGGGGDRGAPPAGGPVPHRRRGGQGCDHPGAAGAGLQGVLPGHRRTGRQKAEHPRRGCPGGDRRCGVPARHQFGLCSAHGGKDRGDRRRKRGHRRGQGRCSDGQQSSGYVLPGGTGGDARPAGGDRGGGAGAHWHSQRLRAQGDPGEGRPGRGGGVQEVRPRV